MALSHIRTVTLPDDRCRHLFTPYGIQKGKDTEGARTKVQNDSQPQYKMKPNRALPKRRSSAKK